MKDESVDWLLDHAVAMYETEWKNSDKLRDRVGAFVNLAVTPCTAITVYFVSTLRGEFFSTTNIFFFWLPLAFSALLLLGGVFLAAYVLFGAFKYSRVPSPSEILCFFQKHPDEEAALLDGKKGLLEEYSVSVTHNFNQNEHRKTKLLLAQRLAFGAFVLLLLCTPRWVYNFSHNEARAQSVKIVSPIQIKEPEMGNSSEPKSSQQSQAKSNTQGQTQSTPASLSQAKPSFPKSTMALDSANGSVANTVFPKSRLVSESLDPLSKNKTGK